VVEWATGHAFSFWGSMKPMPGLKGPRAAIASLPKMMVLLFQRQLWLCSLTHPLHFLRLLFLIRLVADGFLPFAFWPFLSLLSLLRVLSRP